MAEPRKKYSDIEQRLIDTVFSDDFELRGFGAGHLYKAEKNTSKDDKEIKKTPQKPAKTPFEQWARDWEEGDALPFLPPGKIFQLDSLGSNPNKKPLFRDKDPKRKRSLNEIGLMASKSVLGRTINNMPGAMQIIAMVAKRRGIPVDDQGKLRCPAGTPAANQFTDLQMSNCMVPSATTAARETADALRGAAGKLNLGNAAIAGSVGIGERLIDKNGLALYGGLEAAQRFLIFKRKRAAREKLVSQLYGNFRSNVGAEKALLRAFPNMDKESLNKFLNDYTGLEGRDLADYLDMREAFIGSLLYEASKNREVAETAEIAWEFGEELLSTGEGFQVQVEPVENAQPFVLFRYSPVGLVAVKNSIDDNHLSYGISNDPDNPNNSSDFGSYVGTHEFFHLADFYQTFKKFGLDINDTNIDSAIERIEDIANGDVDGALNAGLITPEQHALWNLHEKLLSDIASGISKEDALNSFYEEIYSVFKDGTGLYTPEVAEIMKDVVGSLYGHENNIENRAELGAAASYFPELIQQAIDKVNEDRINNQNLPPIPDLDDITKDMFGTDVITPATQNTQVPKPGVARRTIRAARAFKNPDGTDVKPEDVADINEDVALDYLQSTADNLQASNNRRQKTIRKMVLDLVFDAYTEDEIKKILSSIPVSQRGNNKYIKTLLSTPQRFIKKRSPSGAKSNNEIEWEKLLARADSEDWIDFTALTDTYVLRGGEGPLKTIDAVRKERKRVRLAKREERKASSSSAKLTRKISGSISNPRVAKLSGSMGWVNTGAYETWVDGPNAPQVDTRVDVSLSPIGDTGKSKIQWGDDSWEIDSTVDPNEIWKSKAFKEWSTYHGNYAMRYVSAMLMGQDIPISEGYREETLDEGITSIHDELVSGATASIDAAKRKRVRDEVEYAVAALKTIVSPDNAKPYQIFRGLTGVPDDAPILQVKKGEKIELPLSAFTASEDWAYEMGEFTEDGQGVILKVLPGARSTPSNDEYIENPQKRFDNYFEVVTAGRFEVVEFDDVDGEQPVITLRQTDVFDPVTSTYYPVGNSQKKNRGISGSISSGEKTGTVTKAPVKVMETDEFALKDSGLPSVFDSYRAKSNAKRSMPVYTVGDKNIAFGTKNLGNVDAGFDDDSVEILPVNPYEISGKPSDSEDGQKAALLWFEATVGQNEEDGKNAAYPSALLYAASRGDDDAQKELERLAKVGRDAMEVQKKEYEEWALGFKKNSRRPDGEWDWQYEHPELMVTTGGYDPETGGYKQRMLDIDDIFLVHQTSYEPTTDDDGNIILRPAEEFEMTDPETGKTVMDPITGETAKNYRGTVHFALNHMVQGHMYRQTPTAKTYAVMVPLRSMLEQNEGALDNLYAIDTYMTPKPGEGLKIPKGAGRVVEIPGLEDRGIKKPEGNPLTDWTQEQREEIDAAISEMNASSQRLIFEMLQATAREHNGSDEYMLRMFEGGMHGSSEGVDKRVREIAVGLGVPAGKHDSTPNQTFEQITPNSDEASRQLSSIANSAWTPLWTMNENARLRLANNDRFTSGNTETVREDRTEDFWI